MPTDGEKGKAASGRNVPWIEKYRPTTFPEIVGNQETVSCFTSKLETLLSCQVSRLAVFARDGNVPNIIIAGPPGVGKTTTIMCLAR